MAGQQQQQQQLQQADQPQQQHDQLCVLQREQLWSRQSGPHCWQQEKQQRQLPSRFSYQGSQQEQQQLKQLSPSPLQQLQ